MILNDSEIQVKVQEHLTTFYYALFWSLIAALVAWNKELFRSFSPTKNSSIKGVDVFIGFCLYVISQVFLMPQLVAIVYYLVTGTEINFSTLNKSMAFWINMIILWGSYILLVIFYVFYFSADQKRSIFGDNANKWYQNYFLGASTWLFVFPLVLLWSQLVDILIMLYFHQSPVEQLPVEQFRMALSNPIWMLVMGGTILGIVPIAEEFLFRGLLQSWLKKKFDSPILGILIASIIFAFFHFSHTQGITNIQFISSIFLLSCFLGFLYERQRSLWASIGLHSAFNAFTLIFITNGR